MIISTRGYVQYPTLVVFDRRTEKAEICELNGRVKATWRETLKTMMAVFGEWAARSVPFRASAVSPTTTVEY
jgi:hypothetical protein